MADTARVILDAGHGGDEPGAMFEGRKEKDDNLRLALAVGNILERNGVNAVYTRTTDVFDTPLQKAQMANESGADLFVSFHRNAMPVPGTGTGASTLVYENAGTAGRLAENIQQNLVNAGFVNQGIQERPGLAVLNKTRMPAVLVEAGFIDNPADNRFFDENFNQIAAAIADGILETIRQKAEEIPRYYQVQVGAYRNRETAGQLVDELTAGGLPAFMIFQDGFYKVRVGAFQNLDYAVQMERRLRSLGYPTLLVREKAVY